MEKNKGDFVNEGDVILEMMSDKTSMELEAEESGVLLKIVHGNGATVPVTEVVLTLVQKVKQLRLVLHRLQQKLHKQLLT